VLAGCVSGRQKKEERKEGVDVEKK